jgi:hydroxymethylbilane synthase
MSLIRIGTRASKLALWQTRYIAGLLEEKGFQTEIFPIETKGDKNLNAAFAQIGTKGLFTEELEDKLQTGEIDIAVHSAKDMQTEFRHGLKIIAFTEREEANDVVVSFNKTFSLSNPRRELSVGTSSTRRKAMLTHYYPHVCAEEARGNLQTRFRKMEEGKYEAMILAYAGVHRMEYDDFIVEKLPLDKFIPAVGQGSIAIESSDHVAEEKRKIIREILNHTETEKCLLSERAFLRTLQGGCSIPVFGMATIREDKLTITGGVISLDGKKMVKESIIGPVSHAEETGIILAQKILEKGGDKILNEIKNK